MGSAGQSSLEQFQSVVFGKVRRAFFRALLKYFWAKPALPLEKVGPCTYGWRWWCLFQLILLLIVSIIIIS